MQYGGVDLSSIPIDIVRKVTVFKPPVPVWLGPDSAAGAIYIETKGKKLQAKKETAGKIRFSGGSYGLASASATGQFDTDLSQILISGGYFHRDGRRVNSQKDQGHLNIGYDRNEGERRLTSNTKAFASHHGVAGPVYNPTPQARQRYEKGSLDLKYKDFGDSAEYTFKTWGDFKKLDETANDGSPSRLDTLAGGLGTDVSLFGDSDENELKLGALGEHIRVDHTLTGEHDRTRLSAHGETHIRTSSLVYTLGARGEYTNDFDFSPGGHAGISYAATRKTTFKANAGYSEHIPTFGQLYQPSHGSVDQVRGNPDLDKEKILSLSASGEHQFLDKHTFTLTLFHTETWDLIKYQRDDAMVNEPVNLDRAVKQGIETAAKMAFSKQTGMDISYIWQNTENKENGRKLSYAPEHTVKLVFKTALPMGTRLEWITRGYSDQYSDIRNSDDEKLDAYLATDVKLSHPLSLFNQQSLVFANIHNLFDTDYSSHYGYPDDGFKIELGLSISL
jgi:iron complex outermembrane receptor protein